MSMKTSEDFPLQLCSCNTHLRRRPNSFSLLGCYSAAGSLHQQQLWLSAPRPSIVGRVVCRMCSCTSPMRAASSRAEAAVQSRASPTRHPSGRRPFPSLPQSPLPLETYFRLPLDSDRHTRTRPRRRVRPSASQPDQRRLSLQLGGSCGRCASEIRVCVCFRVPLKFVCVCVFGGYVAL